MNPMNFSHRHPIWKPIIISTPIDDVLSKEIDAEIDKLDIMWSEDNWYLAVSNILKSMYTYVNWLNNRELYIPPKRSNIVNPLDFGVNWIWLWVTTLISLWDIWWQIKIHSPEDTEKFNDKAGRLFQKYTETFWTVAMLWTIFSAVHNNPWKWYCFMADMILWKILPESNLVANIIEKEYNSANLSWAGCAKDAKTFINRYINNWEQTLIRFIRFSKFIDQTLKEFTKEDRETDFKNIPKIVDFIYYSNLFKSENIDKKETLLKLWSDVYDLGHLKAKLNKLNLDSITKFKFLKKFLGQNWVQWISLYVNQNKTGD